MTGKFLGKALFCDRYVLDNPLPVEDQCDVGGGGDKRGGGFRVDCAECCFWGSERHHDEQYPSVGKGCDRRAPSTWNGASISRSTQRKQSAGLPHRSECIRRADVRTCPEQHVRLAQQQRAANHYADVAVARGTA